MLKYSHPLLYEFLRYWPVTVLLPSIFLLIAVLAVITRWWDGRDAERARELSRRANTGEGPPAVRAAGQ